MAVCKVKKVNIFTHLKLKDKIIEELQKTGCIQIKDVTSKIEKSYLSYYQEIEDRQIESTLSKVKYCIDYFFHFKGKSKKPEKFIEKIRKFYDFTNLHELFINYKYEGVYDECKALDTLPIVARHRKSISLISPEGILICAYLPSFASI